MPAAPDVCHTAAKPVARLSLCFLQGNRHDLLLAPAVPGDIMLVHLNGTQDWAIQKASFMACDEMVSIGVKVQGLAAACCSGEGLFVLKATGQGRLLINSYGGIIRYDLKPGEVWPAACGAPWSGACSAILKSNGRVVATHFLSHRRTPSVLCMHCLDT